MELFKYTDARNLRNDDHLKFSLDKAPAHSSTNLLPLQTETEAQVQDTPRIFFPDLYLTLSTLSLSLFSSPSGQ